MGGVAEARRAAVAEALARAARLLEVLLGRVLLVLHLVTGAGLGLGLGMGLGMGLGWGLKSWLELVLGLGKGNKARARVLGFGLDVRLCAAP